VIDKGLVATSGSCGGGNRVIIRPTHFRLEHFGSSDQLSNSFLVLKPDTFQLSTLVLALEPRIVVQFSFVQLSSLDRFSALDKHRIDHSLVINTFACIKDMNKITSIVNNKFASLTPACSGENSLFIYFRQYL